MTLNKMDTYNKFFSNPISGMLFICLTAIGYLYVDSRNQFLKQITEYKEEIKDLRDENKELRTRVIQVVNIKKDTTSK